MEIVSRAEEAQIASSASNAIVESTYSPSAVLHLFNNAINVAQTRRLIHVRGIYQQGRGTSYNGWFYDVLRDEASDASMTLVVPGLLRSRLAPGALLHGQGYIARKVVPASGRIELHIHLDALLDTPQPLFSEDDLLALEIQQQKATAGYRDVEASLRARLLAGEQPRVAVLIGKTAIIDADILHQLGASAAAYDLHFHRVNLHSERAILEALDEHDDENTDLLVISRGGGDGVDVFNSCTLAEACLDLGPPLITAIGHKDDVTLVQRIADRAFITPTALGQFLATLHEEVVEAAHNSKAALIESITKQLGVQHGEQLRILTEKLAATEALNTERSALLTQQLTDRETMLAVQREEAGRLQARLNAATSQKPIWLYVLIAALAGVVLGALLTATVS